MLARCSDVLASRLWGMPIWWWLLVLGYLPAHLLGKPCGYGEASLALLRGESLDAVAFSYPPLFAFLYLPLALLPGWLEAVLWYAVIVVTLTHACLLTFRLVGSHGARSTLARLLTLVLAARFIASVLDNKAFDGLVFYLVLLGLSALRRGGELRAALALAAAAALKLTPLILLFWVAARRRYRLLAGTLVAFLGLSLLPDLMLRSGGRHASDFAQQVLAPIVAKGVGSGDTAVAPSPVPWDHPNPLNQSWRGLLERAAGAGWLPRGLVGVLWLASALVLLGLLLVVWRRTGPGLDSLAPDISLALLAALLISPMSSKSHFVALVLPLAVIAQAVVAGQLSRRTAWVTGAFLLACFVLSSKGLAGQALGRVLLDLGVISFGILVLLVLVARLAWSESAPLSRRSAARELAHAEPTS